MAVRVIAEEVERIVEEIRPLLAGKPPEFQGAVLCDLLAIWLAGHPPALREGVLAYHIAMAQSLVAVNEAMLFGPEGHPDA